MFYVDADAEAELRCQFCEKPFQSFAVAWLASPPDGGPGVFGHRWCLEKHGARLFGGLRYRLRRADAVIRAVAQRLLTTDERYAIVRWDRG